MNTFKTTPKTTAVCLAALAFAMSATAQEPPLREAEIISQLTEEGPVDWLNGVARSLGIAPADRSPEMLAAMIRALEREVEWDRLGTGPNNPSFDDAGEAFGESSAILARHLAATGDARTLPALAWHAYNRGPVAQALFGFGHQAVPHLLAVVMSPDASGSIAREPLSVLASIVSVLGPGRYETQLVEAAALHLDGPPDNYLSRWSNMNQIPGLPEAVALAGALRTPEMMERLQRLAAAAPDEIAARTSMARMGEDVPRCAQAMLDGTEPPVSFCDPMRWARRSS